MRKTRIKALAGFRYFTSEFKNNYFEINAGIENIFNMFRIDFVAGYEAGRNVRTGVVFGLRVD